MNDLVIVSVDDHVCEPQLADERPVTSGDIMRMMKERADERETVAA